MLMCVRVCVCVCQLVYNPVKIDEHVFPFPAVYARGVTSEDLQRVVHAKALQPRLLLSVPVVDFSPKVIQSLSTGV